MTRISCLFIVLATMFVNTANAQVSENILRSFFSQKNFSKYDAAYKAEMTALNKKVMSTFPIGHALHKNAKMIERQLYQKHPGWTAPPHLDINGPVGSLGRFSHNGQVINFLERFQELEKGKWLVKLSIDGKTFSKKNYFLDGTNNPLAVLGGGGDPSKRLRVNFPLGSVYKRVDDFQYRNTFGATIVVQAYKSLSDSEWVKIVEKAKPKKGK